MNNLKRGDLVLTITVVLLAFMVLGLQNLGSPWRGEPLQVIVEQQGEETHRFDLEGEEGEYVIPLESRKGEAVLEIAARQVRILPMVKELCPRGICSAMGWARKPGNVLVCMPNQLVVRVTGAPAVDAITS